MKHEIHFNLGGIWSYDMDVIKVEVDGGLFEDQIVSNKKIIEEKIEGRDKPYFYGVERDPLSFPLNVFFNDNLSNDKVREILRWLDQDEYRPFYMMDDPGRRWYVMSVDDTSLIHNGIRDGYLTLNMRTDDTRTLSPYVTSDLYIFRDNVDGEVVEFENTGDFDCKPIVHITKVGDGNITIKNLSNYTGDFEFTDLLDKEQLQVDCENKEVATSVDTYRYNNFSKNFIEFSRGINRLKVIGDCNLMFEAEFRTF